VLAARAWIAWWILLTGLYLALADSRRPEELVAGAVVGALGATGALLVRHEREVLLRPTPRLVVSELRSLLSWPRDLAALAAALVRRPRGRVVRERFEATGDRRFDAAREAFAVAGRTLAPNTIVIDVDAEREAIVYHRLVGEEDR
jgi:multisubunit Na+/H+ antiporter MnhE subunit